MILYIGTISEPHGFIFQLHEKYSTTAVSDVTDARLKIPYRVVLSVSFGL